jgi:single-strand DNA-binding protein
VDVEVYGKAGEAVAQHKGKGAFLVVDGRLRQNTWEREGQRHSRLLVVADHVSFGPSMGAAGTTEASAGAGSDEKDDLPC